jgi:Lrp/AsnC family transcriptional regulator, leucine-responsive regulatory protein
MMRAVSDELPALDEIDRRLLDALQANGRLRVADLARRLSLSRPAVSERLRRLEDAGVIRGYHAEVDPAAVGYPIAAIVRVRPAVRQLDRIRQLANVTPEVVECHRITGEDCFFLKVRLRSLTELEPLLDRFTPYGQTTTSIIHSSTIEGRGLPLNDD